MLCIVGVNLSGVSSPNICNCFCSIGSGKSAINILSVGGGAGMLSASLLICFYPFIQIAVKAFLKKSSGRGE